MNQKRTKDDYVLIDCYCDFIVYQTCLENISLCSSYFEFRYARHLLL